MGKIHGIRNARKPPTSPAIKVSQRVFDFSGCTAALVSVLADTVLLTLSFAALEGAIADAVSAGAASGAISVNSRSAMLVSASCANTAFVPKSIKRPMTSILMLVKELFKIISAYFTGIENSTVSGGRH
ncbi:hypothetical protein D3C86_1408010 [compost metagenome]